MRPPGSGTFRDQILLLRGRASLTQREVATLVGLSRHTLQKWEAGEGHPSPARLQALIALYVARGVFTAGREAEEATALWAALRRETSHHTPPFDAAWFARLHPAGPEIPVPPPRASTDPPPAAPTGTSWQVWGEAPEVSAFQGRALEQETLKRWLVQERCRLVALLGPGGIGKTALATRIAHDLAPHFEGLCWRSLRNAPPPEDWLGDAIAALAPLPPVLPAGLPARLGLLLELLRERRCLLVLDNLEAVLEPGATVARYRAGYEGYGEVLRQVGERTHQSTLVLTGREAPPELALLDGSVSVRTLRLGGLDPAASRTLLEPNALRGDDAAWQALVTRYGGNPLALSVASETIGAVFGGDITAFLAQETAVYGGIRQLLDAQVGRLSPPERAVLAGLAVEREPVGFAALVEALGPGVARAEAVEAVEALLRRSLLEWGTGGAFTLQPVVLEYAIAHLVDTPAPDGAADASALPAPSAPSGAVSSASAQGRAAALTPGPTISPPPARPPSNLPPERTSFVGRTDDVTTVTRALNPAADTGPRLLTLTGVAGSGKTRLALAVAGMVRDSYADGVWLVELAPLAADSSPDPAAVAGAALAALGLREQPGQEATDTLIAHLGERPLLLVLDNCEHLAAACGVLVARLLGACPHLRVLATSQRPLGLAAETAWSVAPLAVPDPVGGVATPEAVRALGQADAVRLFVERAQAVRPGFALDMGNAAAVADICRQVDGLPLAIELAAARLHVLPVGELLARLDDRFRLLRRGGRIAADRHQTLQATLDWSYGLLDPAERALLRRLSVFAGGWDLAAAEAVCAGGEVAEETVLELLDELLDRSLVYVHAAGGEPRYGLLETVRAYGAQQTERAGEAAALQDRRLAWCASLTEQAAPGLQGPNPGVWLARLDREHDNLRAAMQWALDRGYGALGLRVAVGLWRFWRSRGHLREGQRWLTALLALAAREGERDAASLALRASALDGAAWIAGDGQAFAQAAALFAERDALRRALGQEEQPDGPLITAGLQARAVGDYARATALFEESLARQRRSGRGERMMDDDLGYTLSWGYRYTLLALVLREQGEFARATALCEECLARARERGDAQDSGIALLSLADLARDLGDSARVRALCAECLAQFRELRDPWSIGFALNNLALAALMDGDLATAARHAEGSEAAFRELQAGSNLTEALVTVGRIRARQGEADAARARLVEALRLAREQGPRVFVAEALDWLGVLAVGHGQARRGALLLGAAARLREAMGTPVRPADRPEVEGALAAARAALGNAAYGEAWAAGQRLPTEQVVSYAAGAPEDRMAHNAGAE